MRRAAGWVLWALSIAASMSTGGRALETLCARAWRCGWVWAVVAIDRAAAFYEDEHCKASLHRCEAMRRRWGFRAAPDGRDDHGRT